MQNKESLSPRQKLYCHWLALGKSERAAAEATGYSPAQAAAARKALSTPEGVAYRQSIISALAAQGGGALSARDGYYKLAFGDVSDALRLILRCGDDGCEIDAGDYPDLYNISEIRRGKNGIELRFFDRIDALDRLARLESESDGRMSIYDALNACASSLSRGGEDDE